MSENTYSYSCQPVSRNGLVLLAQRDGPLTPYEVDRSMMDDGAWMKISGGGQVDNLKAPRTGCQDFEACAAVGDVPEHTLSRTASPPVLFVTAQSQRRERARAVMVLELLVPDHLYMTTTPGFLEDGLFPRHSLSRGDA
jgi:hypothetical protein